MKKIYISIISILLITGEVFAFDSGNATSNTVISNGIGLGSVVAGVLSWERNKSVLWLVIHGLLSWFYVIYFLVTRKASKRK